ncbi:MAG: cytidylate kinase-like family protein [Deltaproteobacteria bacterium]|nr:cytidylate kinase-like family protein [Deltaproteobacteria bacterium]
MSFITISCSMGSDGARIASFVAKELKIDLYDDSRLQQEALRLGFRPDEVGGLDEKAPGFFDRLRDNQFRAYLDLMESVVYEVARHGNGVIVGHGSQFLLRDFNCALHVRIYASEASRIQRLIHDRHLKEDTAKKLIHKNDQAHRGFLRFAFHMDWDDPSLYDLVINTEKVGSDKAANLVIAAAQSDKIQTCSMTALESMERLSLLKKVEAAFLQNDITLLHYTIEVPKKGTVYISGFTQFAEEKNRVLNVVKKIPGISRVDDNIVEVPPGML